MDIQDYGIIGNGRSCALVSREGSIDWLCWPRFDSPSIFGAILDDHVGGTWKITPATSTQYSRKYIENTNVLESTFRTNHGRCTLTDFMTAISEEDKKLQLYPEHELIRILECHEGEMEIEIHFNPRLNYGKTEPVIQDLGALGFRIEYGQELLSLHSSIKLNGANARFLMKSGDKISFILTHSLEGPAVIPPKDLIFDKLSRTIQWWRAWAGRAKYQGPYRNEVIRSALTLKLLGYAPSGAFVAAPTTSLPERIHGSFNWDYRYCWLRDASFTVRSLLGLGYFDEAEAFANWMLHSTRLTLPEVKAVYDVYGEGIHKETEISQLRGYEDSPPVRIGVAIRDQLQLDVYGELASGVTHFLKHGGSLDRDSQKMLRNIGKYICKNWQKKDSSIWEERVDFEHYTYSRLMCWVTLDKLIKLQKECRLNQRDIAEFENHRKLIRTDIETNAWNPDIQAYTSYLNGNLMDACALLMPSFEFEKPTTSRMQSTFKRIRDILNVAPGLMYRNEKNIGKEGAFLICSFWKIDYLAHGGGTLQECHEEFTKILPYANDLGLFSEEVEISSGQLIGNFPQAFTHIGLINAALLLQGEK